jgi:hypothetical protein
MVADRIAEIELRQNKPIKNSGVQLHVVTSRSIMGFAIVISDDQKL